MKNKELYYVEVTDTYGGEANYSWVYRFLVSSVSMLGAVRKVAKHIGLSVHIVGNFGDMTRHDSKSGCTCLFTSYADEFNSNQSRIETL